MNKKLKLTSFVFIFFLNAVCGICQEGSKKQLKDTLKDKSYEELYTYFYYNRENDTLYDLYAKAFLDKAYKDQDTLKIATGYYIIAFEEKDRHFKYNDSLIKYSTLINASDWLWSAYNDKGSYYSRKRNFKKALANEIEAYRVAKKAGLRKYENSSNISLGILKERIGKYKEALNAFRSSYRYLKEVVGSQSDTIDAKIGSSYLNTLHLLSNAFRLNKKLDSAITINKEVQKYAEYKWAKEYINKVRLNMAEVHFDKKQYELAIDSAQKAIPEFKNSENLKSIAVCYYVIGLSKLELGKENEGVKDLNRMDSIYSILGDIYPPVRSGYEKLISHYKKEKNTIKQLYYVERLIRFDSITHKNYAFIYEGIVKGIDEPILINEKKYLESLLDKSQKRLYFWLFLLFLVSGLFIYEIRRRKKLQKQYQDKFDKIILKKQKLGVNETDTNLDTSKEQVELGIAKEVANEILKSLDNFEKKLLFTDKSITSTSVAKKINTNANYLGRVIKHFYGKSFRNYINDLRIELALDKLRNDRSFKNFSVQAMANEVGFKNAEPFSKAFKNTTGMYPSDFVCKLKDEC